MANYAQNVTHLEQLASGSLGSLTWDTRVGQTAFAAGTGVISHLGYFMHGEHHQNGIAIIFFYASLVPVVAALLWHQQHLAPMAATVRALTVASAYAFGLYGSMLLYRGFLHPLRRFPGPFPARFSNLWHSWQNVPRSDNYRLMTRLHERYGDIVRTGPSNLSVNVPEAVQLVLGSKSRCVKSPWYDGSLPLVNLHSTRDLREHERRRKVFNKAFSPAALAAYEERITPLSDLWCREVARFGGQPLDATAWFKYFAFDAMGELGFGESFHMIESSENRWVPDLIMRGMADIAQLQPIPWSTPILHRIPFLAGGPRDFIHFVEEQVRKRQERGSHKPDILANLIETYEKSPKKDQDYQWLRGDTRLTIVGGSDTTATTLVFMYVSLPRSIFDCPYRIPEENFTEC
jgi:tryprostatin B 6-hydroxylase